MFRSSPVTSGYCSHNWLPQGIILPKAETEDFMYIILRAIVLLVNLLTDHLFFPLHLGFRKRGIQENIREKVCSELQIFRKDPAIKTSQFFAGESIQCSTHGIDLFCNIQCGPASGSFENHMFDEVADAVLVGSFKPGTGANPNSEGYGLQIRNSFGDNSDTIIKRCLAVRDGVLMF